MCRRHIFLVAFLVVVVIDEGIGSRDGSHSGASETMQESSSLELNRTSLSLWLQEWSEQHANSSRHAIVVHPRFGLGNRILSVISAIGLALATNRRLYIEWGTHFEYLFTPTYDWVSPKSLMKDPNREILDLSAGAAQFTALAERLTCSDLDDLLPAAPVVHVTSDQFFLPLLLANPHVWQLFSSKDPLTTREDEWKISATLGRWLMRPAADIRKAVLAFEEQMPSKTCEVGIHFRAAMAEWESSQVPKISDDLAMRCAKDVLLNASRDTCRYKIGENQNDQLHKSAGNCVAAQQRGGVFVATTSENAKRRAGEVFGKRVVVTRGVTERIREDGAGERQALMDLLLLSRCTEIVSSVHSTFSYAAHLLGGKVPWVVTASANRAGDALGTSTCIRSRDPAPCFHQWHHVAARLHCLHWAPLPEGTGGRGGPGGGDCWY